MRWPMGLGFQAGGTLVPPTDITLPSISGTAQEGQTLTADPGTWSDNEAFTYQWTADGVNIGGATGTTFVLTAAQVGKVIRVVVTDTLPSGASASATSSPTSSVIALAPTNSVAPAISGTAQVGQTLSCSTGTWLHTPVSYAYQWKRAGSAIGGATNSTYVVQAADDGSTLTCTVTATNSGGSNSATSSATASVTYPIPVNTVAPVVSGSAIVGQTLSTTNGTWTNSPTSYTYQWKRDGVNISSATNSTYALVTADHGAVITCAVIASNDGGSSSAATSNGTSAVVYAAPANTVAPVVSGTAKTGQVLSTTNGTFTGSGITYSYQWKRGSTPIGGATSSTYTVVDADHGSTLKCTVTATNDGGAASADSNATSAAVYANPVNTVLPTISGTAKSGQTLTAGNGTWTSSATPSYTYQWKADGTNIGGATASTFVVTDTQHGKVITVEVTATNDGGGTAATSAATSAVVYATPVNTVAPAVPSGTQTDGQVLTADNGTWTGGGISYTYQWQRNGTNIGGATASTYTLVTADVGNPIRVVVTATNDGGAASANSAATGNIASSYVYPVDAIGTAAKGAYGFRKLRSAYSGNCIKVRRSSDNTTQDIGFSGTGLDTASLATFVGANNGFIDTWYDQSGNGYNLTQATQARQPRIVNAGTLDTKHGNPAAFFDVAADHVLSYGTFGNLVTGSAWSALSYAYANAGSSGNGGAKYGSRAIWEDSSQDLWQTFYDNGSGTKQFVTGNQNDSNEVVITVTYAVEGIFTSRYPTTGTTFGGSVNGGVETTHSSQNTTVGSTLTVGLGGSGGSLSRFDGYIGELIFYNVALSQANMSSVASAMATYWAQSWTNLS